MRYYYTAVQKVSDHVNVLLKLTMVCFFPQQPLYTYQNG